MRNSKLMILIIALIIVGFGILSIYSSTYEKAGQPWKLIYQRQILWLMIGLALFFLVSNFNYRHLWDVTYFLYVANLFLLLLVFALGAVRLGAQRWLKIAWFNFQPSELSKLIMVIFLARYFSKKNTADLSLSVLHLDITKALILPFFYLSLPLVLIIQQPDLGSGLIILFIFIGLLYIAGIKLRYIAAFLLVDFLFLPLFWHTLRPYQRDRLLVFLNPNLDPLGAGYTIIQSKVAIGSGGLFGKGWLSGTQSQLRFLPESHTDFIFATFAEQWGLIGSITLVLLYYALIRQAVLIALRTQDQFGRLFALGIALMLGIQVFVNMAMNIGLAPVVGIPLPLMSYGGSSLFVTFVSLGILVNIDKTRSVF